MTYIVCSHKILEEKTAINQPGECIALIPRWRTIELLETQPEHSHFATVDKTRRLRHQFESRREVLLSHGPKKISPPKNIKLRLILFSFTAM